MRFSFALLIALELLRVNLLSKKEAFKRLFNKYVLYYYKEHVVQHVRVLAKPERDIYEWRKPH